MSAHDQTERFIASADTQMQRISGDDVTTSSEDRLISALNALIQAVTTLNQRLTELENRTEQQP